MLLAPQVVERVERVAAGTDMEHRQVSLQLQAV
jgi:hypothetical protein